MQINLAARKSTLRKCSYFRDESFSTDPAGFVSRSMSGLQLKSDLGRKRPRIEGPLRPALGS